MLRPYSEDYLTLPAFFLPPRSECLRILATLPCALCALRALCVTSFSSSWNERVPGDGSLTHKLQS
jgi:hypothetical protein